MNLPRVWNKRGMGVPLDAVYVGRPSVFGNPFSHLASTLATYRCGTRTEAIDRFKRWLAMQPELIARVKTELRGRDLVCWCAPLPCHADELLRIANEDP